MEIRIRTAGDFQDSRVTIEIQAEDIGEAGEVAQRLYDPQKAAETMAENYQRARAEVDRLTAEMDRLTQGHVCTVSCEPNRHVPFIGHHRLTELENQLAAAQEAREIETRRADRLQTELRDVKAQMGWEINRADTAQADARADERALWEDRLATEQRLRRAAEDRLVRIGLLLNPHALMQARSTEESPGAQALAKAIRQVQKIVRGKDENDDNSTT
jgi:hypothetical protein